VWPVVTRSQRKPTLAAGPRSGPTRPRHRVRGGAQRIGLRPLTDSISTVAAAKEDTAFRRQPDALRRSSSGPPASTPRTRSRYRAWNPRTPEPLRRCRPPRRWFVAETPGWTGIDSTTPIRAGQVPGEEVQGGKCTPAASSSIAAGGNASRRVRRGHRGSREGHKNSNRTEPDGAGRGGATRSSGPRR